MLLSIQTKTDKGQVAFHIVTGSVSADLPDGDTVVAWTSLKTNMHQRLPQESWNYAENFKYAN